MKKIITVLLLALCLSACSFDIKEIFSALTSKKEDSEDRYSLLVENVLAHNVFSTSSNYFDISAEMAKIEDGYRFYVTIDNPRNALYDVEAIAVEEDVDYSKVMAANVGIFEDSEYCLIPNQTNAERGYVEGLVISGLSNNPETTLYVYVSFKNEDRSNTRSEYFKLDVKYED